MAMKIEQPVRIVSGQQFTEGPLWHPDGYLLFSDIPASRIMRWTPPGKLEVVREPSGQSNGLALDLRGRLLACEHGGRRVSRAEADGSVNTIADRYEGKRLNSPNDVVVRSDGSIYFTDPPYGVAAEQRELSFQGIYRIHPSGLLDLLIDDCERPNGLAFSPDEKVLYVADTALSHITAFAVDEKGALAKAHVLAELISDKPQGPDGMKVDTRGNLYVACVDGVWVLDPEGKHLDTIPVPERPANVAFGEEGNRTLFVTARSSVYRLQAPFPGIAPLTGGR